MRSASMLAIVPLQDWLATDATLRGADAASERINVPADLNHYWRYRMHITLEQLLKEREFNNRIKELVAMR
jgi:4-alpha-glucanotransferase